MRRWIDNRMMPLINGSDTAISDTTKNMLSEDSTFKEYLMHFVKEADFNISDIKIKKMAALFGHKVETERGEEDYVLPENSQSAGTTRMVELESIIYSQLKCQGLLCVDELEASIHPNLMEYMLTRFVNRLSPPTTTPSCEILMTSSARIPSGLRRRARTATATCSHWLSSEGLTSCHPSIVPT